MKNLDQKTRPVFGQVYSQVPTSSPPQRLGKEACSSARSIEEDQLSDFVSSDKITFTSLKENLLKNTLCSISTVFNWSTC